jgi:hypothetical protein
MFLVAAGISDAVSFARAQAIPATPEQLASIETLSESNRRLEASISAFESNRRPSVQTSAESDGAGFLRNKAATPQPLQLEPALEVTNDLDEQNKSVVQVSNAIHFSFQPPRTTCVFADCSANSMVVRCNHQCRYQVSINDRMYHQSQTLGICHKECGDIK